MKRVARFIEHYFMVIAGTVSIMFGLLYGVVDERWTIAFPWLLFGSVEWWFQPLMTRSYGRGFRAARWAMWISFGESLRRGMPLHAWLEAEAERDHPPIVHISHRPEGL